MDRKSFFRQLEDSLSGKLSDDETTDIMADYREFFDSGLLEGDTEEEVLRRLGDPSKIALTLVKKENAHTLKIAPIHKRTVAFITDILVVSLPFIWLSPRFALTSFFAPQYVPMFLSSFFSTIKISNHWWIASARAFWLVGVVLSGIWFVAINPFLMWLLKGQTLGKKLLGVRVVDRAGGPLSVTQIISRELLGKFALNALLSTIWLPLGIVPSLASLIMCTVTPAGTTVWDAISRTAVTSERG